MGLAKFLENFNILDNFKKTESQRVQKPNPQKYTQKDIVNYYVRDMMNDVWDGEKFYGSFGNTKIFDWVDYYTLRKRSVQLFKENQYARGIIRKLLTNEIYTGLNLEANPISQLIGISEDEAVKWSENTELLWNLWSRDPYICDYRQLKNLGQLTIDIRQTALLSGDCLVVLRINRKTNLPWIEIIDGANIMTPIGKEPRKGNTIKHGIEFKGKRQVAYWVYVKNNDLTWDYERVPVWGEKSGRRISWMVYGSDRLLDDCRGEPILANMLYMLKDLDRYRDAETRAAVVNAIIPLFVKQVDKGIGGNPFTQGAARRETATATDDDGTTRDYHVSKNIPGMVPKMPYGQEIESFNTTRPNVNFGKFEEIILNVLAWTIELPPEILKSFFQNNFSASRQANNELQIYINKRAWLMGIEFLQNLFEEWVIAAVINGDIKANGLVEAWFSGDWKIYNGWLNTEWSGLNRPSVDGLKDANESEKLLQLGLTTFDIETRKNRGMKFRKVAQKLASEKQYLEELGLTSSIDENNLGEPLEKGNQKVDEDSIAEKVVDLINIRR